MKKLYLATLTLLVAGSAYAGTPCGVYSDFSVLTAATNLSTAMNGKLNVQCGSGAPTLLPGTAGIDGYVDIPGNNFYLAVVTGSPATWVKIGGVSSSAPLTTNKIPKATGAGSVGDSSCTDNGTIVACTEPISSGAGGSTAGVTGMGGGTQSLLLQSANSVGFISPASVSGQHYLAPPATDMAAHNVLIYGATSGGISQAVQKTIPDCQDSAGNHLNFTQGSDTITCGNTTSGGGTTMPVGSVLAPWGTLSSSSPAPTIGTNNHLQCLRMTVPSAWTVQNLTTYFYTATGSGVISFGLYQAGTLVTGSQTSSINAPGSGAASNFTFNGGTPLILTAGIYDVCWSSSIAADKTFIATGDGDSSFGSIVNANQTAGNFLYYTCSGVSTTVGSVTTMPSSCGTQSAISNSGFLFVVH